MESVSTSVSTHKKKEITQKEMDDFLCFCEEFLWIDYFDKYDKFLVKSK